MIEKVITINEMNYWIQSIPFEDIGEKDENGFVEYYYKGKNFFIRSEKGEIQGRLYEPENEFYFFKNPNLLFEKDVEWIKNSLIKEFGVKKIREYR